MYLLLHKFFRKIKRCFLKAKIGKKTSIGFLTQIDKYSDIGKYNYIGNYCLITKAKIGNYCSIADNVIIGPGEHDYNNFSTNSIFNKNKFKSLTKKDCIIENDVWIGANSIVLRGVKIGNGAVIGAGTIVTRNVPEYSIFVGNPGKVIKYRFEQEKIEKLLKSKWWEKDYKNIKESYNID